MMRKSYDLLLPIEIFLLLGVVLVLIEPVVARNTIVVNATFPISYYFNPSASAKGVLPGTDFYFATGLGPMSVSFPLIIDVPDIAIYGSAIIDCLPGFGVFPNGFSIKSSDVILSHLVLNNCAVGILADGVVGTLTNLTVCFSLCVSSHPRQNAITIVNKKVTNCLLNNCKASSISLQKFNNLIIKSTIISQALLVSDCK